MAQDWPLRPHPRTEGRAPQLGLWAWVYGWVGCTGLETARVFREAQETTQLAWALGPLGARLSQAIFLGFDLSRINLSLEIVSEFAQGPPHSCALALCLNRESGVG